MIPDRTLSAPVEYAGSVVKLTRAQEASKTRPSTSSAGTEDHNGNSVPADSPEARKLDSAAAGFTTTSPGSVATAESGRPPSVARSPRPAILIEDL